MFLQASRENRRAALKALYASAVQSDAEALVRDYHAATQRLLPAGVLFLLALAVAAGVLVTFTWPAQWWTDPPALTRVAIAAAIVLAARLVSHRLAAAPAARFEAVEHRANTDIVPNERTPSPATSWCVLDTASFGKNSQAPDSRRVHRTVVDALAQR